MVAQDYHPNAYLLLHTDAETLRAYDDRLSQEPAYQRLQNRPYSTAAMQDMVKNQEIISEEWVLWQNVPFWLYDMITKNCDLHDDLTEAVYFDCGSGGVLLNKATGLLVVWV